MHRFRKAEVLAAPAARWVPVLRVLLDYRAADGLSGSIGFTFDDGSSAGLLFRNLVAVPIESDKAAFIWSLSKSAWADLLSCKATLSDTLSRESNVVGGTADDVRLLLGCFDIESFKQ